MSFDQVFLPAAPAAYLDRTLSVPYPVMEKIEADVRAQHQPAVGRQTGGVLRMLAISLRAKRVLEVGTNLGYSTLWLAAGLAPDGRVEGIELDEKLASAARANLNEAIGARGIVHEGAALDVLPRLPEASYDLIFLDAVKAEYPDYLDHALRLLRRGGIVAADNMFWQGKVWDEKIQDADTLGVREYTRRAFSDKRLATTIIPVEDGLAVSLLVG